MGKLIKSIALVSMLCLGLTYAAKADSIPVSGSATSDVFTGVDVFSVTNSLNPFGVTPSVCPGTAPATCNQSEFGGGFEVATVTFGTGGAFSITETTPGGGHTVSVVGATPLTTISGYCAAATSIFTPGASALTVGAGTECTSSSGSSWTVNGNSQGGAAILTYLGNGVFSAVDNSIEIAFQLTTTSTPEPSSLLMLGSGILGLMGLGFRRKGASIV
jgi:hypothetical protein